MSIRGLFSPPLPSPFPIYDSPFYDIDLRHVCSVDPGGKCYRMGAKRTRLFIIATVSALAVISATVWRLHGSREIPVEVDLASPDVIPIGSDTPPLRITVAPILSPSLASANYQPLVDYLSKKLDRPFQLVQQKTYGETTEVLRYGAVQTAVICPGALLRTEREKVPLEIVAVPVYADGMEYRTLVVVRADLPAAALPQLRGRAFAYTDRSSLMSYIYTLSWLLDHRLDPDHFFSRTVFTHSHDNSLRAIMDGLADAAAVNNVVYESELRRNPEWGRMLRVIHRSPPLGPPPVVVPASIEPILRERIRQAFIGMADSPDGRETLASLGIERFEPPSPGLYDAARDITAKVDRHLARAKGQASSVKPSALGATVTAYPPEAD